MWTQAWCAGAAGEAGMHMHHAWAAEQVAWALVAIAQASSCHASDADSDIRYPTLAHVYCILLNILLNNKEPAKRRRGGALAV